MTSTPPTSRGLLARVSSVRDDIARLRALVHATPPGDPAAAGNAAALAANRDQLVHAIGAIAPAELVGGLDASVPLALLPVRLETRFADPDVLRVRIFPDDAHADSHDPDLTANERSLGTALWAAPNDMPAAGETPPSPAPPPDGTDGRRARWASLVRLYGGPRAAFVAHATRPGATAPTIKPVAYNRPPVARGLPDRWLVRAYAGGSVVGEAWSSGVRHDLHLAPDPGTPPPAAQAGAPRVDDELRWMLDYTAALAAGMAVDVTLPAGTTHLDRVVVVGVRASTNAADSATELAELLTAHRYTEGIGFLRGGSPTSNTPGARSDRDRRTDPDALWQLEMGPPSPSDGAAARLAASLGIPSAVLDGTSGGGDEEDADAHAMQTALWSATWGYYLTQLLDPGVTPSLDVAAIRDHYLGFVRGGGTMPVLAIGRQPYGVLPLLPLARWTPDGASPTVDGLAKLLTRVRPLWQYGVGRPVSASAGPGFDDAFIKAMSTDWSSRGFAVRTVVADRTFNPVPFTGIDTSQTNTVIDAIIGGLLGLSTSPLFLDIFSPDAEPVRAPLVVDPRDPTPDATVQQAIRALRSANPWLVLTLAEWLVPHTGSPATLLHTLLRRSVLLEYAAAGVELNRGLPVAPTTAIAATATAAATSSAGTAPALRAAEVVSSPKGMLVGLTPDPGGGFHPETTLPSVLSTPIPSVTGGTTPAEWLWRNPSAHVEVRQDLDENLAALDRLSGLLASDLELLLREVLDTCTHRWTAWAESIAGDKLTRLRTSAPVGVHLGGWGVVEGLDRRRRTAVDLGQSAGIVTSGTLWGDERPGGFVHAPSTAQAATAAVLRSAHLAHGGDGDPTFAVDLSSARAREARRLAEGVRNGQELGALLGYELERALHERNADVLIAPLRAYAPRWKASGTFVEGEPTDVVSPSAVVDGLALSRDDPTTVANTVLPQVSASASAGMAGILQEELANLSDRQHALADLFHAEWLHHALAANTARASGAFDAAHRGGMPPDDYDVLRTLRPGAALTCRVAVLLPEQGAPRAGGWPDSPRDAADPALSAWLSTVLPAVQSVRLRVANAGGTVTEMPLPAAAAGLGALDVVLDRADRVRSRILLQLPNGSSLVDGRGAGWPPSTIALAELLTVAGDLAEVVASRALRRADLLATTVQDATSDERDAADLLARASASRTALGATSSSVTSAIAALATTPLPAGAVSSARDAVAQAWGLGVELQLTDESPTGLAAVLEAASTELARRLETAAPQATAGADEAVAYLKGLLGSAQPALPRWTVDAASATAMTSGIAAGDGFIAADPELATDWLDDLAPVRDQTGRAVRALQGCEALASFAELPGRWRIVETSPTAPMRWTALADAATLEGLAATGNVATVVLRTSDTSTTAVAAGSVVSGLLIDEWTEVVPGTEAATTITYQGDAPTARAPQAILLGVAPDVHVGWDVDTIVDLALEAVDLAQLRTVDLETGAWLGRMLPAVLLPDGDASDVIAAPALPLLQVDAASLAYQRQLTKELG
jgi:hypothetical protein